jgi:hypothetical protein
MVRRGPVRGPSHPCKQCDQRHRRHGSVVHVQVVHTMRPAGLSHNPPVVSSSPTRPTCSFSKRARVLRQMVLRSSGSCEATAYWHEYCEGTAAGAVAKRRQRMFYPSVAAYAATTWADAIRCARRPVGTPVRAVSAASSGAIYGYRRVGQRWRSGGSCESGLVASPAGSEVVTVGLSHRARPAGQLI